MKKDTLLSSLTGGLQIAILFLPVNFLNEIVLLKLDYVIIPMVIIPVIFAFFTGLSLYSRTIKQAFAKIILSVPFTVLLWYLQIKIKFSIRALNWIIPNYGKSSAGGNFANFIILCSLALFEFVALLIFMTFSIAELPEKIHAVLINLQKYLVLPLCILVIAVIVVLNNIMPMYNPIYG